jgi:hypothetical protein
MRWTKCGNTWAKGTDYQGLYLWCLFNYLNNYLSQEIFPYIYTQSLESKK